MSSPHKRQAPHAPLLPEQEAPESWLRNFADLTFIVAHELNNSLNNMLLQVALLEYTADGKSHRELATIRQLGHEAAGMLRQLQQISQKGLPPLEAVDLNQAVRELVPEIQPPDLPLQLKLEAKLPPVLGTMSEVKRLVKLLLRSAAANASAIIVRTLRLPEAVQLRVEDTGPALEQHQLARLFEPFAEVRPNLEGWELAVCKALTRRLRGTIHGENQPGGGIVLTVDLQPATE
jgi:signal transduction histidine kinase